MNLSIRRRLLIAVLSAVFLAWTLMATSSYWDIRKEIEELLDAQLAQSARALLAFNTTNLEEQNPLAEKKDKEDHNLPDVPERLFGHRYENKLAFQIWTNENKLVLRSANAPIETPLTDK